MAEQVNIDSPSGKRTIHRERQLKESCKMGYHIKIGLIATTLNFFTGVNIGYFSSTARKISTNELTFSTDESDVSILSNAVTCSTILGPLIFTYSMNYLGRKPTILLFLLPLLLQYIVVHFTTCTLQLIIGLSIGSVPNLIIPSVLSVYISEVASPHLRGSLNFLLVNMYCLGSLIGLVVNWKCSLQESSLVFVVSIGIYFLFALTLPETPHYLIKRNFHVDACVVLEKLYGQGLGELEAMRIAEHLSQVNTGKLKDIVLLSKNRHTLGILFVLYSLKYFSGVVILIWFSPILLTHGNYRYLSPFSCELIIMCITNLVCCFYTVLYRFVPRRHLGISSVLCYSFPLCFLIAYFYVYDYHRDILNDIHDILPLLPLLGCIVAGSLGMLPQAFMYFRELTPVEYVVYYSLIMDLAAPVFSTVTMFIFNYLRLTYGYTTCFVFFLFCLLTGGILYYFFVPETHKKIIENIQEDL